MFREPTPRRRALMVTAAAFAISIGFAGQTLAQAGPPLSAQEAAQLRADLQAARVEAEAARTQAAERERKIDERALNGVVRKISVAGIMKEE